MALARALDTAQSNLKEGQKFSKKKKWESAIEMFTAGLDVKGTHDENLTATLTAEMEAARASMSKRDEARCEHMSKSQIQSGPIVLHQKYCSVDQS